MSKWSKPSPKTGRCRLDCGKGFFIIDDPLKAGFSYRLEYRDTTGKRNWLRMDKSRVQDRDSAYEEHLKLRSQLADGRAAEPVGKVDTFSDGIPIYLEDKRADKLRSYGAIEKVMKNCLDLYFGDLKLRDIKSQTVKKFRDYRRKNIKDSTIKIECGYLRDYFNLMIEREYYVGTNPVNVRKLKLHITEREVYMSAEQENVIWPLLKKYPPMEDLADFLYGTTMRPGNIITLSWDRILWDKKEAFVSKEEHKQKFKHGHYLLNSKMINMLRRRQKQMKKMDTSLWFSGVMKQEKQK